MLRNVCQWINKSRNSFDVAVPNVPHQQTSLFHLAITPDWQTSERPTPSSSGICGAVGQHAVGFFFVTAGNRVEQMVQGVASVVKVVLLVLFASGCENGIMS